jgi:hypothetical protein
LKCPSSAGTWYSKDRNDTICAGCQWFTSIILAAQEADQEDQGSKPARERPYLEKPSTKIGLVECIKVKVLEFKPLF